MRMRMTIPPAVVHPAITVRWLPDPPEAAGAVDVAEDNEDVVGVEEVDEKIKESESKEMELAMGELVAKAPCPEAIKVGDGAGVLVTAFAADTKASYIAIEGGFIAPTIPDSQWDVGMDAWQKNQIVSVMLVMSNVHTGVGPEKFAPLPLNPLSKPPSRRTHGASKALCVTVCSSPPN
jgi:hypothetical protein